MSCKWPYCGNSNMQTVIGPSMSPGVAVIKMSSSDSDCMLIVKTIAANCGKVNKEVVLVLRAVSTLEFHIMGLKATNTLGN
ncbi:hypothetical protein FOCC_FOCC016595 [Frankliniella occidentalis]|nr:hypothetical protein FOCC_FOCC016595 [Frankliniella occidentalis]